ncbi:MAG: B12-binding domain-containing radical SAM protein [Thermodesulfobacteriota bacterium]
MKILLFNPAARSGWQPQRRVELPLCLLCPATGLDRQGYDVQIIDGFASPSWKKELLEALKEKPLCFGVTSMTGPQILHALEGCRMVRKAHPDVPLVWGGIHSTLLPEQTLENPYVDILVTGEGEATFDELVKALEAGTPLSQVKSIWYKENGKAVFTGTRPFIDFDAQPPLSYDLVVMDRYKRRLFGRDHISFTSSRGCTSNCAFCWEPAMNKRKWRPMKAETVLEHLKRIVRDHDMRGFLFTDDNFFVDMDRAHRILEGIVRADLGLSIAKVQIRADRVCKLDRDFLNLLVRANVRRMSVGVESGNDRVLELVNKGETVEQIIEANRILASYPIVPLYLIMMGLPTETPDELEDSVRLAIRLTEENPRAVKTFNIYTPYPGTALYDRCVELGLKKPERLEAWARFNYRNVPKRSTWLAPEMSRLVQGLDFPLMFLGKGHFVNPYKKTNPVVVGLSRLYYPLARYRVENMDVRFPVETKLVKTLGLFGRQD